MTLCETLDGQILLFQLIYTWKTKRSLPSVKFPRGFCLSYNSKHWSNESETLKLIDEVLVPHIEKVKKEKSLPDSQKSLLLWDAFKAQSTQKVKDALSANKIEFVMVPKNMTHLLQPLEFENREFSNIFTSCIMKVVKIESNHDVATIEVDLHLSTLKLRWNFMNI